MSYAALRAECEEHGIGPLFWQLLLDVCARVSRRYPPDLYNDGAPWSEEACRDLALEVSLERLLEESQLEYVLATSDAAPPSDREDVLARLLAFQARRALNHRRSVTVVDRLHGRIKVLVESEPFLTTAVGSDVSVSLGDGAEHPRALTEAELRRAVQLIGSIPRLPSRPSAERESKVYKASDLAELVRRLAEAFGSIFLGDIRTILERVLTAWLPAVLREGEAEQGSPSASELELQRSQMNELIYAMARALDPIQRLVLVGKSQGISDGELAAQVGRSRPWLADRKAEVLALVERDLMAELPQDLHDEAASALLNAISLGQEAGS